MNGTIQLLKFYIWVFLVNIMLTSVICQMFCIVIVHSISLVLNSVLNEETNIYVCVCVYVCLCVCVYTQKFRLLQIWSYMNNLAIKNLLITFENFLCPPKSESITYHIYLILLRTIRVFHCCNINLCTHK